MNYYEVAVEDRSVKGAQTLTYSYDTEIPVGSVVRVSVRNKVTNGLIIEAVNKPSYQTKPIQELLYPAAVPKSLIELAHWMSEFYATELGGIVQTLIPRGAHKNRRDSTKKTAATTRAAQDTALTADQKDALATIQAKSSGTVVLHGVTGSGKTRIYIERAEQFRDQGKGSIILVPEIGLTSQMVADFQQVFPDVFVLHSNQSEAMRHKQWEQILQSKTPVVVGPRSALFSPVQNLGLIVVDEEHETSYKQDQSPKYHAVRVAAQLAKLSHSQLILGSATPRIEDYYLAQHAKAPVIRIADPVKPFRLSREAIKTIDLRDRDAFTKGSRLISNAMFAAIDHALANDQQVMLFHNRRGSSTIVVCTNCGWVAECPNCLLPLTHHADWQRLVCHICNHREAIRVNCPDCGKAELLYKGIGTKQIVSEIRKFYPKASVARFDSDVKKDEQLETRYQELYDGKIDIIVGTQMVAKGLDLPKLGVVGVALADTALYLPDYSANERAFQLLYQVIGRVGRHQDGQVVVQSYTPDHPALQAAMNRDYSQFYDNEIKQRELMKYPPFAHLLQLSVTRKTQTGVIKTASDFAKNLESVPGIQLLGPSPAFHEKTPAGYNWHIVLKSRSRQTLVDIAKTLPANWHFDLDPINLL